jgi:hypothetical protein
MHKEFSMIKQILTGCLAFAVVLGGYTTMAQAQTQAPANSPAPAPGNAPAEKPPAPQPAAPAATPVSPEELQKFSKIVKQLLVLGKDAEAQIAQAIKKEGLTEERFGEIYASQNNPQAKPARQVTPKEQQSYNQALTNVRQIQESADAKLQSLVKQEGLEVQRFNQIFAAIQRDPKLRQEVQKMIGSPQSGSGSR